MKKFTYKNEGFFCIGRRPAKPSQVMDMEELYQEYKSKLSELFNFSYSSEDLYKVISIIQIQYVYTVEERFFSGIFEENLQRMLQKVRVKLDRSIDNYIRWRLKSQSVDFNSEVSLLVMFSELKSELINNLTEIELCRDLGEEKGPIMRRHWDKFKADYFDRLMSLYEKTSKDSAYDMRLRYLKLEKFVNDMIYPHELPKKSLIDCLNEEVNEQNLVKLWARDKMIIADIVAQWRRSYATSPDVDKLWMGIKSKIREIYIKVLAKRYHPDSNAGVLSAEELAVFSEMSNYLKEITSALSRLFVSNKNSEDVEQNEEDNETWWEKNIREAIIEQQKLRQKLEQEEALLESQAEMATAIFSEKNEITSGVNALCRDSQDSAETLSVVSSQLSQMEARFNANEQRLERVLKKTPKVDQLQWEDPGKQIENAVNHYLESRSDPKG